MSKIAEKRTDEIVGEYHDGDYTDHSRHNTQWVAFKQGYDQAMQDMVKDSDYLKYLSDNEGYAYACGCRKTMQDFLEKAERWLEIHMPFGEVSHESVHDCIQEFKNHMQDEM